MKVAKTLGVAILVSVVLVVIMGQLGSLFWFLELFSHFQVQYFIVSSLVFLLFLYLRSYCWATVTLFICLIVFSSIAPYVVSGGGALLAAEPPVLGSKFRIMFYNTLVTNNDYDAIAREISLQNPDIVILAELTGVSYPEIKKRLSGYEFSSYQGGMVPYFDLAYFSRVPVNESVHYLSSFRIPTYDLGLSIDGKSLRLIGVHTSAPLGSRESESRNGHLMKVASLVSASNTATVVLGDLNITPWSPIFRGFIDVSGLREARLGIGVLPSWNSGFASAMRIPIDHILTKGGPVVSNLWTGISAGSDHLPIIADLRI